MGADETACSAASADSHTQFVNGIVAIPGGSGSLLQQWMTAQDARWRHQVTTASAPQP